MKRSGASISENVRRSLFVCFLAQMVFFVPAGLAQTVVTPSDSSGWSGAAASAASSEVPTLPNSRAVTTHAASSSTVTSRELAPGATIPPNPGSDAPDVHVVGPVAGAAPAGAASEPSDAVVPPDYEGPPPPSTTEIPAVVPANQQGASALQNSPDAQGAGGAAPSVSNPDIAAYTGQQSPLELQRQVQTLQDFMEESDNTSSLGLVLRESRQRVINGGDIPGLLIVSVISGSPAAAAGLHGYSTAARSALEGAAIAASLFFPPAIIAVAVVDGSRVGESYDMIIGVDSNRVTNFLEFSDQMRDVQPGEIVYLSVLRNGRRVQVPVQIPPPTSGMTAGVPSPLSPTDARAAAAAAAAAAASP